jgi:hypothetical protein
MSKHGAISPEEAAAIRELVEAYAYCADRRGAEGQMSLLTADTHFVVYMNAKGPTPSREFHSRAARHGPSAFSETKRFQGFYFQPEATKSG